MPSRDWHDPKEWLEGEKLNADEFVEQFTDNLIHLFEKNFDVAQVSGVSDYQTTSTTPVAVSTALTCNIRKYSNDTVVKLSFTGSIYNSNSSQFIYFDVLIDNLFYASTGTATPATAGLMRYQQDTGGIVAQASMEAFFAELPEGNHTFLLVWWVSATTGTVNVTNTIAQFSVEEYGVADVSGV